LFHEDIITIGVNKNFIAKGTQKADCYRTSIQKAHAQVLNNLKTVYNEQKTS